jgi:CheY-like chemotaxis protein
MYSQSVLVVDADVTTCNVIAESLRAAGHGVRTSPHALAALTELSTQPADVVICSLQLPGRDGRWLVEQLDRHHRSRVIICPPDATPVAGLEHCSNIIACHPKPVDPQQLRHTLRCAAMRMDDARALSRGSERRRAERFVLDRHCGIAARLKAGPACAIVDLSTGGAQIEIEFRVTLGRTLDLQFTMPHLSRGVRAAVTRCTISSLSADRVVYTAGVQFVSELPIEVLERLLADVVAA